MTPSMPEQNTRYLANPRQCIDCGGKPGGGQTRCDDCHSKMLDRRAAGENI